MTTLHLRKSSGRAVETRDPLSAGETPSEGFVRTPKAFVMKIASKKLLLLSLIATFVAAQALAQQIKPDESKRIELNQAYGKLPLSFEANQGQTAPQVKFLSRGSGYGLFLTNSEAVLVLTKGDKSRASGAKSTVISQQPERQSAILRMRLAGANTASQITGQGELPGEVNYFIGNDPAKWRTQVPTYAKVRYDQVYPGIDLVYYG